ncbi:LamG-like jellyroll fold domain-containing protein [Planctomycetota bacterium]
MFKKAIYGCTILVLSLSALTWADFRTVGVYDPDDEPHHNQVDQSGVYGSHTGSAGPENVLDLATFQQLIGPAFAAGTGGVIDGEGPEDSLSTDYTIIAHFGTNSTKSVSLTHTGGQLNLGSGGASGNRLPLSGDHRFSRTGSADFIFQIGKVSGGEPTEAITYFAGSLIERDDSNPAPLVTATFSDGSTVTSFADMVGDGGSPNNKDTFFGFKAPADTSIISVAFDLDANIHLDEIAFIASPVEKTVEAVMSVEAGEPQIVAMHDVTDPNSPVDPALLDPTHSAWPMAFSTNPNSPLLPQPVAVELNGSLVPDSAAPSVTWSATDENQAAHVAFDNAGALSTNVTFDEPNLYSLTLTVDDGLSVKTDTVLVKVKLAENALQAHWKFDGDPDDPNDYDWYYTTYTGSPDFGPGLIGDAIIVKPGDSVSYGNSMGAETSISVAFWMKPASDFSSDTKQGLVRKFTGNTPDPQGGWTFQMRSDSDIRWRCSSGWDAGVADLIAAGSYPADTWTHIVGTYEGNTRDMKFYIDGQLAAQRTATADTCFDWFVGEMTIGSDNWSGMIDDLYVFDYPLIPDEIRPLVLKGMNVAPDVQVALDQVKIILPTQDVQLAGTVVDNGPTTLAWTVVEKPADSTVTFSDATALMTTAQFESAGNYRLRLIATDKGTPPMSGSADVVVKVRPAEFDGMEAHITFDDQTAGSNLSTSVPYVGELFGDPTWIEGVGGEGSSAILLDGVDDHINFDAYLGSDPCCTIALWIGNDALDQDTRIIQKWASDGSGKGWFLRNRPNTPGQIAFMIGSGFSGSGNFVITDAFFPAAAWTHIALTFDGSFAAVYMNGVQVYASAEEIVDFSPADLVTPMVIGYRSNNDSSFFTGAIDEVRIYDYALSAEALEALYKADGGE